MLSFLHVTTRPITLQPAVVIGGLSVFVSMSVNEAIVTADKKAVEDSQLNDRLLLNAQQVMGEGDFYVGATIASMVTQGRVNEKAQAILKPYSDKMPGALIFGSPPFSYLSFANAEIKPLIGLPKDARDLYNVSNDGRKAFLSSGVIELKTGVQSARPLLPDTTNLNYCVQPAYSRERDEHWMRDNKFIIVSGQRQSYSSVFGVINTVSGRCVTATLPDYVTANLLLVSPDGQQLWMITKDYLVTANLDGTNLQQRIKLPLQDDPHDWERFLLSPDGSAFYISKKSDGVVMSPKTGHYAYTEGYAVAWTDVKPG